MIDRISVFYGIEMLVMFNKKVMIGVKVMIMIRLFMLICISV